MLEIDKRRESGERIGYIILDAFLMLNLKVEILHVEDPSGEFTLQLFLLA